MDKTGIARPGAAQMILACVLMALVALGPLFVAATRPSHEWSVALNGLPAFALFIAGIAVFALYVVGFLRYCVSKGYSAWLGVLLLFGNIFGFVILLLLPDLKRKEAEMLGTRSRAQAMSRSGTNEGP